MAKRRKRRPGGAKSPNIKQPRAELADEPKHNQDRTADTQNLKRDILHQVYWALIIPCSLANISIFLLALASVQVVELQSMLSLQWDAALEQWASKVSPKLASPQLSMAFFLFQDAAFVCALAW